MSSDMHKIYIEMLGRFSMMVDDQQVDLGTNNKANFLKLLQIVILNKESGITKRELIDGVFGYKDLLDENNSLNNLLHQTRTQLKKGGVPGKKFIEGKKGVYKLEEIPGYEVEVDLFDFRDICAKAEKSTDEEEKAALYQQAFAIYKGELLPDFATDYWVIIESVQLRRSYELLVDFLGQHYRDQEDYEALYQLYKKANVIYPDRGWQIQVIDALILKGEFKAAYDLYNKTAKYYLEELEVPLPEELLDCYNRIYDDVKVTGDDIEEIQTSILRRDAALKRSNENHHVGAYHCAFSSFVDVYHVLRRNLSRRGSSIFMMLCTLVDYEGKPIANQEKLANRAEALQQALSDGLRQGDVFTKYSSSQYLVLLIGTKKEDCSIIYQRIARKLKENAGSRAEFRYRIVSLAEIPMLLNNKE